MALRILNILFAILTMWSLPAKAEYPNWLLGSWKFIGYIYQGEFKLPLNPKLLLIFEFRADGTDTLYWSRQDEVGFCERRGIYSVANNFLTDEVVWVNPDNSMECGQDPDMRLGKRSTNEVNHVAGRFHLHLSLAGEPFIYVFEALNEGGGSLSSKSLK